MKISRSRFAFPAWIVALLFVACSVEQDGHDDHGHEHGHGGERPSVAVTRWTDDMELFMEYPVLVAGEPGEFIIHLTILDRFQPVREGSVSLEFESVTGKRHEFTDNEVRRDGIFIPEVTLSEAGPYTFTLLYSGLETPQEFVLGDFGVFQTAADIPSTGDEAPGEISFLKEQQWKIAFATSSAEVREIRRSVWAVAKVLPSLDAHAEIVAPVDGHVKAASGGKLAMPGAMVRRGAALAAIVPPVLGEGWASARLAFEQAKRDYERAQRLRNRNAISDRESELAENSYLAKKAGYESLPGGDVGDALTLRAPISGQVIEWNVHPGERVSAGDKLMAVVDPAVVWLEVNVYESDFHDLGTPVSAYVDAGGSEGGWTISNDEIRVLTRGGALDPATRTIPILLEVDNHDGRLAINGTTPVELHASDGDSSVAVPRSAIFEDGGVDFVMVQTGGESFEKRTVTRGPHHAGWVSIVSGIEPGERVVTTGGYQVKLASTSGEIGHGHAH